MDIVMQGDIIQFANDKITALVLSREFFNKSGMAVLCPIGKDAPGDALHIRVVAENYRGVALIEHLKSMDLRARHFRKIDSIDYNQIQNISDAVQGIFDYYPFGK